MKVDSDFEVFSCSFCGRHFYGEPEFRLIVREGFGDEDVREYKFCSKDCLKKFIRRELK